MTPMKVDRKLWKKFRGACDEVFARLDQQRVQAREAMGEQIAQAEELISKGQVATQLLIKAKQLVSLTCARACYSWPAP